MKSITIAVIFAGLMSYGTIYAPPTSVASGNPIYASLATPDPPLSSDPDDYEEQNRVSYPNKRNRRSNMG